jgi:hypothetical protein
MGGWDIISGFMRKSKLPLKKLYTFVSHFLKKVGPNRQAKKERRTPKIRRCFDHHPVALPNT